MVHWIGELIEIYRHPVKSLGGESLEQSLVKKYGLYGDRAYAFLDHKRPGALLTARQVPEMLGYKAELCGEKTDDKDKFPRVKITSPAGRIFDLEEEAFKKEIEDMSGRQVTLVKHTPEDDLLAVDTAHILLITTSSLRKLEKLWGKPITARRFRANFIIALDKNEPFVEREWLGGNMIVGDVELKLNVPCPRCNMINIDPDSLNRDRSLLKTVVREREGHFGIYASVIKTGAVKVGDKVGLKKIDTIFQVKDARQQN